MKSSADQRIRILFWLLAISLGALQAWASRHDIDSDGISYLDHGDAFFRGEWGLAINSYWSPLYSWLLGLALFLLKPSPYWEFAVVHLANFLVYLGALAAFDFFLRELTLSQEIRRERFGREGSVTFQARTLQILGFTLFIWSSLTLISIREVTPDMCVAGFVYLACAILLRIRRGGASWSSFILLGGILGFGYLAKSPMLPLSFVFLGISLFSAMGMGTKKAFYRTLSAFAVFALIASPYVLMISRTMGRLTFGESARWHYLQYINVHPVLYPKMKKIYDFPPVYDFSAHVQGTYPIWFDPAYWSKDVLPDYFDPPGLLKIWALNAKRYYTVFFSSQGYFIFCFLLLLYMSRRRWLGIKDMVENCILVVPALAALCMYASAPILARYVGPFVVLLWLGLFLGMRLPDSKESRRLLAGATLCLVAMMGVQIAREEIPVLRITIREILKGEDPATHSVWRVARQLEQMGVKAGDNVASIGSYSHAFWARLARARIIAQIHHQDSPSFWGANASVQSQVLKAFASTGAKVLVAERVPVASLPEGWQRIQGTDFIVRPLQTVS